MKVSVFVPPLLALLAVGGLLGSQRRSIGTLEKETVELRGRIAAAERLDALGSERSLAERLEKEASDGRVDEMDWRALGEEMGSIQRGGVGDMRSMMKLQTRLMEMDGDELVEALDEVDALELGREIRQALQGMLVGMLVQKDPRLVLERFVGEINDERSGMSWQLSNAFNQWQMKDSAAATAWLDAEIAKGTLDGKSLDGKSPGRTRLEAALVNQLLKTDPEAASDRLKTLPEEQRKELFQQGSFHQLSPGSEKAFAAMVRESVPEGERGAVFGNLASNMVHRGGYAKVSGFLDEIDASSAERNETVRQVAQNKMGMASHNGGDDRKSVDEMREWVADESPDELDSITGTALAAVWGNDSLFEKRLEMVEEFHAESGSDELITSFLRNVYDGGQLEMARELAMKISDEEQRESLIKRMDQGHGGPMEVTEDLAVEPAEVEAVIESE